MKDLQTHARTVKRGCGQMKPGGFYATAETSPNGGLHAWVDILGDGYDETMAVMVPPQKMLAVNPAAILASRELYLLENGPFTAIYEGEREQYEKFERATRPYGLIDHVGSTYYSAHQFRQETMKLGPSRRIAKSDAQVVASLLRRGPVPILFTHSRIPVFSDDLVLKHAKDRLAMIYLDTFGHLSDADGWATMNMAPTWEHEKFGMFARRGDYDGHDHFMLPVLSAVDAVDRRWRDHTSDELWSSFRELLRSEVVTWPEQLFGASWITGILHTVYEDGSVDPDAVKWGCDVVDVRDNDDENE